MHQLIHFLTQRLNIEEETAVEAMQNPVRASTPFVTAARLLFSVMPTSFNRREFTNEVIEDFDILKPSSFIRQDDYSVRVFHTSTCYVIVEVMFNNSNSCCGTTLNDCRSGGIQPQYPHFITM